MTRLSAEKKYPMVMPDGTEIRQVVHLKHVIDHPRISVGDFTYYHSFDALEDYAGFLAPYLFPLSPERLRLGRFCQLAHGVRFITSSANHAMEGFSTFPFHNFMMTSETTPEQIEALFEVSPAKGDTVVGNDVWFGMNATILPGVTVGDGAIIGAHAVVSRDVAPYSVVAGNPATIVRQRFDATTVATLQEIAWWDWPVERIEDNLEAIRGADLDALWKAAG